MNPEIGKMGASSVDWTALIGKAMASEGEKITDGGASAILNGDNVTITVRDGVTGQETSCVRSVSQLRAEHFEADVASFLEALAAEIEKVGGELGQIAGLTGEEPPEVTGEKPPEATGTVTTSDTTRTTTAQKALFSIYELMQLMHEVAQQQRDSAREIRLGELQREVASIKNQAAYQRQAATYGLVVSAVTTAVQGAMLIATSVTAVKGLQKMGQSGAAQDVNQAKIDLKTAQSAGSLESAQQNTAALAGKCSPEAQANVDGRLAGATEAKGRLEAAQEALDAAPANAENRAQLEQDVADAKATYKAELDKAVADMDSDYSAASEATKAAEGKYVSEHSARHPIDSLKNGKAMDAAQKAQADLGSERALLRAKVAEAKCEIGDADGIRADIESATGRIAVAENALKTDIGYLAASGSPSVAGAYQQLTQMIGNIGQSLAQFVEANESAKATEEQANQKELEARRQETNDLFQQAQELVNNVHSLLQAVIQAESQSVEQIIRA